jgi:hypothetical protein
MAGSEASNPIMYTSVIYQIAPFMFLIPMLCQPGIKEVHVNELLHRTPSVGSLIKKLIAINPDLTADQLIRIVKQSVTTPEAAGGEFAQAEVIDESMALRLAQNTKR